jgi:CRP/FNR family cyclic AMP-dependent transcriptional regulator
MTEESIPLFEDFSNEEIKDLLSVSRVLKFGAGDFIFRQGDPGNEIYIIFSGEVELSVINKKNEELIFPVASNGTILGEISFFDGKFRTATIKTLNDLEAIIFSAESLTNLETKNPRTTIKFLKEIGRVMTERLRWADTLFIDLIHPH